MKNKPFKLIISFVLMMIVSCDEPETVVTNIVHSDGSVTREIEMKSINDKIEDRFDISDLQVPYDSTWAIKDSCEMSDEEDTIWVRRAVKLFKNVDELNLAYKTDSGANKAISRHAAFKKSFKWFNTKFRFAEIIERKMSFGYPVSDFLNEEELMFFYSPEIVNHEKRWGPDSLKFRALSDTVDNKLETWEYKNLVAGWIDEFSKLAELKEGTQLVQESLKSREDELVKFLEVNEDIIDSLWSNGIILKEFLGDT
ncbi:MAG: hypothetical protein Q7J06_12560, partial [Bacteroidales bacterium]|nr:hypothetical protein [Bacteroidales bacterium]